MALNNIGTYPFQENYGGLRIEEYSWSANSDQLGCDLGLLAVTVNESLNLTIGGPLLGRPSLQRYVSVFKNLLETIPSIRLRSL